MKIRIYDRFDKRYTCVIWDGVESVADDGTVYFEDGTREEIDTEYADWEEIPG